MRHCGVSTVPHHWTTSQCRVPSAQCSTIEPILTALCRRHSAAPLNHLSMPCAVSTVQHHWTNSTPDRQALQPIRCHTKVQQILPIIQNCTVCVLGVFLQNCGKYEIQNQISVLTTNCNCVSSQLLSTTVSSTSPCWHCRDCHLFGF